MTGVHFLYEDFEQLLRLHIGMSDRLDENRAESFTILHCNFAAIDAQIIENSLQQVLRGSDSIINFEKEYFFVLPYTDKYGASIVNKMFEDFFAQTLEHTMVSYPIDGDTPKALLAELQDTTSLKYKNDLAFLDTIVFREG
jgi:hypothetical protein